MEQIFNFALELSAEQIEATKVEKKKVNFDSLSDSEKKAVILRVLEIRKSITKFNVEGEAEILLSIYSDVKAKFTKGAKYLLNDSTVILQAAEITGSNNFVQLTNFKLKLSGASFITEQGIFKAKTFANLIPID